MEKSLVFQTVLAVSSSKFGIKTFELCDATNDCVGTLRTNRKNVPKKVKDKQLKKGELAGQHCGPVSVENTDKKVDLYDFCVKLVEKLFMKYAKKDTRVSGHHSADSLLPRLTGRHFIRKIPPSGKKQHLQRRCDVCAKHSRRRDTVYFCKNCGTLL
ncbi:hypothetical protein J437_LFUL005280 [Ladona fulva]|uniref:Uncharacterized protein n=1 Tax=Ladona fulva TaxID=123851 RepID=A0A8K0K1N2_LADFU|nr:hypothetical protein J437_LFUL005280 [Ladona fulva]